MVTFQVPNGSQRSFSVTDGSQLSSGLPQRLRVSRRLLEEEVRDRGAETIPDRAPSSIWARGSVRTTILEANLCRALL